MAITLLTRTTHFDFEIETFVYPNLTQVFRQFSCKIRVDLHTINPNLYNIRTMNNRSGFGAQITMSKTQMLSFIFRGSKYEYIDAH